MGRHHDRDPAIGGLLDPGGGPDGLVVFAAPARLDGLRRHAVLYQHLAHGLRPLFRQALIIAVGSGRVRIAHQDQARARLSGGIGGGGAGHPPGVRRQIGVVKREIDNEALFLNLRRSGGRGRLFLGRGRRGLGALRGWRRIGIGWRIGVKAALIAIAIIGIGIGIGIGVAVTIAPGVKAKPRIDAPPATAVIAAAPAASVIAAAPVIAAAATSAAAAMAMTAGRGGTGDGRSRQRQKRRSSEDGFQGARHDPTPDQKSAGS